jgi:glycosyltransferase involved in cell wall biosynthesis
MTVDVAMVATAGRGGVHQYGWLLSEALNRSGVVTALVIPERSEVVPGPPPLRWPIPPGRGPRSYRAQARRLLALAGSARTVHFQAPLWSLLDPWTLVPALRRRGIRVTATVHNVLPHRARPHHRLAYGRLYAQLDGLAVHSATHVEELRRLSGHLPAVVFAPFGDFGPALGEPAERPPVPFVRPSVLFAGQIRPGKGLDDLIKAMHDTAGRWQLVVAGEPLQPLEPLRRLAQREGVELVAPPELTRYLEGGTLAACVAGAHVVAAPYRRGWNSAIVSTAAHWRRPTVASTAAAPREVLSRLPRGSVVEPGDVHGLRAALSEALAGRLGAPEPFPPWSEVAEAYAPLWASES